MGDDRKITPEYARLSFKLGWMARALDFVLVNGGVYTQAGRANQWGKTEEDYTRLKEAVLREMGEQTGREFIRVNEEAIAAKFADADFMEWLMSQQRAYDRLQAIQNN